MQDSLPAGWLAFAGRESNPLDRGERFPSYCISSPFPGLILTRRASDPTETLPIDYCALRGPDLYAILYEDRRALCLARADADDSIVRLIDAHDAAALEHKSIADQPRKLPTSAMRFGHSRSGPDHIAAR